MVEQCPESSAGGFGEPRGWRLDRRLNLGTLLSLACTLAVVMNLVTGLAARLDMLEDKLTLVEKRIEEGRATAMKVERIEERILGVQSTLTEIRDELKAQRQGG